MAILLSRPRPAARRRVIYDFAPITHRADHAQRGLRFQSGECYPGGGSLTLELPENPPAGFGSVPKPR